MIPLELCDQSPPKPYSSLYGPYIALVFLGLGARGGQVLGVGGQGSYSSNMSRSWSPPLETPPLKEPKI